MGQSGNMRWRSSSSPNRSLLYVASRNTRTFYQRIGVDRWEGIAVNYTGRKGYKFLALGV